MRYKVITISREFGSGGRTVGKQLAEKLGIPCYDREIIEKVAEESGYDKQYIEETGEYTKGGILNTIFQSRSYGYSPSNEDIIWKIQAELIRKLAREGPCVIVGRCADYVLSGRKNTVNVFIHAPIEDRVRRIMALYQLSEADAMKAIATSDKERGNHYFRYTDRKWGKAQNYDLSVNSSLLGIDGTVEMLADIAGIEDRIL